MKSSRIQDVVQLAIFGCAISMVGIIQGQSTNNPTTEQTTQQDTIAPADVVTPTRAQEDDSLRSVDKIIIGVASGITVFVIICACFYGFSKRKQLKKERQALYRSYLRPNSQMVFDNGGSGFDNKSFTHDDETTHESPANETPIISIISPTTQPAPVYDNVTVGDGDVVRPANGQIHDAHASVHWPSDARRNEVRDGVTDSTPESARPTSASSREYGSDSESISVPYEDIYTEQVASVTESSEL